MYSEPDTETGVVKEFDECGKYGYILVDGTDTTVLFSLGTYEAGSSSEGRGRACPREPGVGDRVVFKVRPRIGKQRIRSVRCWAYTRDEVM